MSQGLAGPEAEAYVLGTDARRHAARPPFAEAGGRRNVYLRVVHELFVWRGGAIERAERDPAVFALDSEGIVFVVAW
jgi:hypothetical protein